VMLDQASLPWFAELNRSLNDELDDAQFRERIRASTAQLGVLATEMLERACAEHPALDGSALRAVLASARPAARTERAPLLAAFA
ncbi:MAG: halogenase, partial [Burkholderiales bacterium]